MLPRVVSFLLLGGMVALGASITEQIRGPHVFLFDPGSSRVAVSVSGSGDRAGESFAEVAEFALFGVSHEPTTPREGDSPEVDLHVRLMGLIAGEHPELGRALLAGQGERERWVSVGDSFLNGVTLRQVYADRVALEWAGGLSMLRLPALAGGERSTDPHLLAHDFETNEDQAPELRVHPERLLSLMRPVRTDGRLEGLQIAETTGAQSLEPFGLRPGDLILMVNGVPVSAVRDPGELMPSAYRQRRLDLGLVSLPGIPPRTEGPGA
jgi:general secretion pathway protein C